MMVPKFRAWHKVERKYYECHEINFWWSHITYYGVPENIDFGFDEVILEQYTGLKALYGKEIYVGDILYDEDEISEVVFKDGVFGVEGQGIDFEQLSNYDHKWWEIIGNIHEDKHLLNNV